MPILKDFTNHTPCNVSLSIKASKWNCDIGLQRNHVDINKVIPEVSNESVAFLKGLQISMDGEIIWILTARDNEVFLTKKTKNERERWKQWRLGKDYSIRLKGNKKLALYDCSG